MNTPEEISGIEIIRPIILGLFAMIIGVSIWSVTAIISGYEIGYIGILVAFLIGKAILLGSDGVKNVKLQIIGVLLTIFAIGFAQVTVSFYFGLKEEGSQSQLLQALGWLIITPEAWWVGIKELALAEGMIGWLIIAGSVFTVFRMLDQRLDHKVHKSSSKDVLEESTNQLVDKVTGRFAKVNMWKVMLYAVLGFFIVLIILGVVLSFFE